MSVVFLHGLNTYGDDDLHIGPLRFGSMNAPWESALKRRGLEVLAPVALGSHPIEKQAELVREELKKIGWWHSRRLHLIGHSSGGLIARVLASHSETPVLSVTTVGTPNHGTLAAEVGMKIANQPIAASALKAVGYDPKSRLEVFARYTKRSMREFNSSYPERPGVRYAYGLCEAEGSELSLPLRPFYGVLHPQSHDKGRSDGFVDSESQKWGERIGRYRLDHFGNLGFFFQAFNDSKAAARQEFERLVDDVAATLK